MTIAPSRRTRFATLGSVPFDLVLLRHGQSTWNELNLFTGWADVDLTSAGEEEAARAGRLLASEPSLDLRVVHTSVLTRAVRTANITLDAVGRSWLPVRRHWRLNERHYGALQGLDKMETAERYGRDQVVAWRRSYDVPPPPLEPGDERRAGADPRYRDVPPHVLPATECLADVVARVLPYWDDAIVPDLLATEARGGAVLVVAHGNSLRALRKHLDGISDAAIVDLDVPTGIPFRYRLGDDLSVLDAAYLGDPEEARQAAEAVARQAG
jgi:2,3-bisphosphoglycerate-dependent phosphoglycerate mutase